MENANQPATKKDLQGLGTQLSSELQHAYDDLKETVRDVQTELLKAFYNYSETTDVA